MAYKKEATEEKEHTYIAIDLKSFYASVECVERGLDPLNTCLVVADQSRTNKTICLAVSPALKAYGVPGRPRLFEVEKIVKDVNRQRMYKAPAQRITGKSIYLDELQKNPSLQIDYVVATPRMQYYIDCSNQVYETYLKYVSKDDIHVYSIDEVFIDITNYFKLYGMSAHMMALMMIKDVLIKTGVTATAGIGSNMYLAKVAMDIVAKHMPADKDGVRIAELDEISYRQQLWDHQPLTDFWRVGPGIQRRLAKYDIHTMGDLARYSLKHDGVLYKEFGINAELLIDHAWGWEPTKMEDIKGYHSENKSTGIGQVLMRGYGYDEALTVVKEMINSLALDLQQKKYVTDAVSIAISYDSSNELKDYEGGVAMEYTGKIVAKPTGGTIKLKEYTSSASLMRNLAVQIYEQTTHRNLLIRRINVNAGHIIPESEVKNKVFVEEYNLFNDPEEIDKRHKALEQRKEKDAKLQSAMLEIRDRFGKNAIMNATSLEDGATGRERNQQIGGHKK